MSWTQQESCWLIWDPTRLRVITRSMGGTIQYSLALRKQSSSCPPTQGSSGPWYKRGKSFGDTWFYPLSLAALQVSTSLT